MFYTVVDGTYVPTTLGNVLLIVLLAVLLVCAVIFARRYAVSQSQESGETTKKGGKLTAKQLVFCAMSIALGTILSEIKIIDFPWGGSATLLSMLVICLPGYLFGLGAGLMTSIAYGILQLLINPYVLFPMQLMLDYVLAFGALGLSGLFAGAKKGLLKGYLVGILGRWIFTVLSGWIFFAEYAWEGWHPLAYSLVYNGIYIFAEGAITCAVILVPAVSSGLAAVKKMALS